MIIGGGELYAQLIDRADRLYITHIDLAPQGSTRFPEVDPVVWREVHRAPGPEPVRGPSRHRGRTVPPVAGELVAGAALGDAATTVVVMTRGAR